MPKHYDVIVLGLGGMGSSTLAHLALRGRKVLGLEQFNPAHKKGSSHGDSRIIRQAYFENPGYVPLLFRAYELWDELEQRTGKKLFLNSGGLVVGIPREGTAVLNSIRSARQYGLEHEVLDAADIRKRWPLLTPHADEIALFEPRAGILLPEEAILAHIEVAVAAGAEARFGTRVTGWRVTPGGGVAIQTIEGEFTANRVVIAAGAWFSKLAPELDLPLRIERNIAHYFQPADSSAYSYERLPIYIVKRETGDFYGFPTLPGKGVKVALHHSQVYVDPEEIDRNVYSDEIEAARQALYGWMPGAAGAHLGSGVCMFQMTPDVQFVVGLHPAHPQVVVATGFSGHGYKFCSVMGEVLADLAIEGTTQNPIGFLAPGRFSQVSGH